MLTNADIERIKLLVKKMWDEGDCACEWPYYDIEELMMMLDLDLDPEIKALHQNRDIS